MLFLIQIMWKIYSDEELLKDPRAVHRRPGAKTQRIVISRIEMTSPNPFPSPRSDPRPDSFVPYGVSELQGNYMSNFLGNNGRCGSGYPNRANRRPKFSSNSICQTLFLSYSISDHIPIHNKSPKLLIVYSRM